MSLGDVSRMLQETVEDQPSIRPGYWVTSCNDQNDTLTHTEHLVATNIKLCKLEFIEILVSVNL